MTILLETKNLHLKIANKTICQAFDLQIKPGERWGILGPNGSGKTTLLHAMSGLQTFHDGQIWLRNQPIKQSSPKKIARYLGILLQDTSLVFPQSVIEYCLAGRHPHLDYFAHENKTDLAIAMESLRTMELETLAQQNIFRLSGGERRRLAIATLLTQTPQIYLLDEPTNHLDLRHQIKTLNHFKCLTETTAISVIMSLHDLNLAQQYCSHIVMLFEGGETVQGTVKNVLTTKNVSKLYQYPLTNVSVNNQTLWLTNVNESL
jgi:iron complex transport system ATP-binding protein